MHRGVAEPVLAGEVAVEHAEYGEQRGLAGTGRAHDGDEVARLHLEADAPEEEGGRGPRGYRLVDALEADHSTLSAVIGSTRAACRAGSQAASRAAPRSVTTAVARMSGSVARTS